MQYPKWLYHPECEPVLVVSEAQHKALGSAWVESPAEFDKAEDDAPASDSAPDAPKKRGRPKAVA